MKHDDHDFGGKLNSGGDAEANSPIGRELEARVVAAVAGEASAFEAAELERLAAENPAVAEFRQRIESVHALVIEAAQPDAQPLRLSAERRAKVLAAIGATPAQVAADEKVVPLVNERKKAWHRPGWLVAMAACAACAALFFVTSQSGFQKVRVAREAPAAVRMEKEAKDREASVKAALDSAQMAQKAAVEAQHLLQKKAAEAPFTVTSGATTWSLLRPTGTLVTADRPIQPSGLPLAVAPQAPGFFDASVAHVTGSVNQPPPPATQPFASNLSVVQPPAKTFTFGGSVALGAAATAAPPSSDIVKLDAFEVSAPMERSYAAASTLSASRLSMKVEPPNLADVATNIETMARDLNRVDTDAQHKTETPSGLVQLVPTYSGTITIDDPKSDIQITGGVVFDGVAVQRNSSAALAANSVNGDIIDTGLGGVARPNLATTIGNGTGATDIVTSLSEYAGIVTTANLSVGGGGAAPFQLSSDKDTGYAAKIKAEELSIARGGLVTAEADKKQFTLMESGTLNLGSASAVSLMVRGNLVGGEKEKADAPLVRAKVAADETLRLETSTATQAVSTFSLHVSDVSFRLAQAALARGQVPDPATIRPEEFYNALNYGDPAPSVAEKVGLKQEQSAHPFLAQRNLLRVALKVAATGRAGSTPLRLTVLLDTSGSMEREDRAATVRRAMEVLVSLLGPNDRLTLIGFARQPRLLAENISGDRAREVLDLIARTPADGGTNMEEALKLATQLALRHRDAKAQNRVVMLTDGAANLGNAVPEQLATRIEELRQRGIAFDACGVGLDGLDDGILEALTRKGDGRYTVLNSPDDAGAGFAQKLAGAFRPAAENVKVQVRFNPARVATYRLIGFEQHRLKEQDFRNDKVDAAELAAEEAGVALYQFEPLPQGEGDVGEVFVRFRDPATGAMVERSWTIPYEARAAVFDRAAPSLQLAGVAGLLAEKLRADAGAAQINLRDFATVMSTLQARYRNESRVQELATMFAQARRVTGQ